MLREGGDAKGKENAALALGNLANENPANQAEIVQSGGIKPLVALVRGGAAKGKEMAAWALAILADDNPTIKKLIAEAKAAAEQQ